ncbi:hypothetical protein HYX19_05060 [Candidatus Woesearchaeota archaeon]|nr:hypothetical protein [Candidatus Woesearchaeota archaeon]
MEQINEQISQKSGREYGVEDTIIKDLPNARKVLDFETLKNNTKKKGSLIKLSHQLNIEEDTLIRAINEAKISALFPGILKSKADPLSRIKVQRELELFVKYNNIHKLEVRHLREAILKWNKNLEENPRILLTELQHDLIIGSTLGDAYVRQREKNCNLRIGHTKAQEEYLLWEYNIFKEFTKSKPIWNLRKLNSHIIETLELATFTHPVFNYYRKLFYDRFGKKKVTRQILDLLSPQSLAIWICDDGSYDNRQGYIVLCTNSYSLGEHQIIKEYFQEVWQLNPTIGFRDKKYYYLRFKQGDSKKLIRIIRPFMPNMMKYKIGEKNG